MRTLIIDLKKGVKYHIDALTFSTSTPPTLTSIKPVNMILDYYTIDCLFNETSASLSISWVNFLPTHFHSLH
jgi:hypothetical protein